MVAMLRAANQVLAVASPPVNDRTHGGHGCCVSAQLLWETLSSRKAQLQDPPRLLTQDRICRVFSTEVLSFTCPAQADGEPLHCLRFAAAAACRTPCRSARPLKALGDRRLLCHMVTACAST